MTTVLALACVALLAYANGANDNFKGVATLFGSGVCVGEEWVPQTSGTLAGKISVAVESQQVCQQRYTGAVFGISAQKLLDGLHYFSAGAVSFARGVNDTPKVVALMLLAAPFTGQGYAPLSASVLSLHWAACSAPGVWPRPCRRKSPR